MLAVSIHISWYQKTKGDIMTQLREKMIRDMQLQNFTAATQRSYLNAVSGLAQYHHCSPDKITPAQIEDYIIHLLTKGKKAPGTCYVIYTGLRFFYTVTLGLDEKSVPIPPVKKVTKLPDILSIEEVERLFSVLHNPKHRALLMTVYSGGLRVSEVVRLQVTDIQSDRMMIRVEQGKGRKDRYTLLSKRLLEELRSYWSIKKPRIWLFPGLPKDRHLSSRMAEKIYIGALKKAGIKRKGNIHTLRHCFATHLLESGVNIRTVQELMGHKSIMTTVGYLHVTSKTLQGTKSPLDSMNSSDSKKE